MSQFHHQTHICLQQVLPHPSGHRSGPPSLRSLLKFPSTCSYIIQTPIVHLTVVVIFYGTILFMYGKHQSKDPLGADKQDLTDKLTSLFYGVVTPMLNPIIYSLRNKDVKKSHLSIQPLRSPSVLPASSGHSHG